MHLTTRGYIFYLFFFFCFAIWHETITTRPAARDFRYRKGANRFSRTLPPSYIILRMNIINAVRSIFVFVFHGLAYRITAAAVSLSLSLYVPARSQGWNLHAALRRKFTGVLISEGARPEPAPSLPHPQTPPPGLTVVSTYVLYYGDDWLSRANLDAANKNAAITPPRVIYIYILRTFRFADFDRDRGMGGLRREFYFKWTTKIYNVYWHLRIKKTRIYTVVARPIS